MTSSERSVVALYGGSFDPPHVCHVLAASYVLSTSDVDKVLVVPAYDHPFGKRAHASFEHRVRMCELAFAELERVEISRIEGELGGQSRTIRTLEALLQQFPAMRLRLMIGADLLGELNRWYEHERIVQLAPLLVVGRSGYPGSHELQLPAISSTEVRKRLQNRLAPHEWVPRPVLDHITEHSLYP